MMNELIRSDIKFVVSKCALLDTKKKDHAPPHPIQ